MKSLVVFFSRNGNNYVDSGIKDLPVGNTFKVEPVKPYPAAKVAKGLAIQGGQVRKAEDMIAAWLKETDAAREPKKYVRRNP